MSGKKGKKGKKGKQGERNYPAVTTKGRRAVLHGMPVLRLAQAS